MRWWRALRHRRRSVVWDLGANAGRYTGSPRDVERVVALDIDPAAGERH